MIDTAPTFEFPAVRTGKITAAFDGGRISSDGGVMLLAGIERGLGIADRLAELVPDRRDPSRVTHRLADTAVSGRSGRQPGSPSAATVTMHAPKPWTSARLVDPPPAIAA